MMSGVMRVQGLSRGNGVLCEGEGEGNWQESVKADKCKEKEEGVSARMVWGEYEGGGEIVRAVRVSV